MKWIKNLIKGNKKNKEEIMTEEQLISYKQNFTGQTFQWIKTDRPELMGKIVKCRDIQPSRNTAIAIFEDGSKVDVKQLNNKLMMIFGDTQPLSKAEVASISNSGAPKPPTSNPIAGDKGIKIPDELKEYQTKSTPESSKPVQQAPLNSTPPKQVSNEPVKNPFEMFNSDYTDLTLKLSVKIPDKKLLKMMYSNAEDKDDFLNQISNYVHSLIDNKTVLSSVESIFIPKSKSKTKPAESKPEEIKLTEVDGKQ